MTIKTLFLLLLALLGGTAAVRAQQPKPVIRYYNLATEARYRYHRQEYKKALELLQQAFAVPGTRPQLLDRYCEAICHLKLKHRSQAIEILKQCLRQPEAYSAITTIDSKNKYPYGFRIRNDEHKQVINRFEFIEPSSPRGREIQQIIDSIFTFPPNREIGRIMFDSGSYYVFNDGYFFTPQGRETVLRNPPMAQWLDTATFKSHEQVQQRALTFIEHYGYPSPLNTGGFGIFLSVTAHLSPERKTRVAPLMEKAYEDGKLSPEEYAFFLERWEMDTAGGTWCGRYSVIHDRCQPGDWAQIIANRKSLGLNLYLNFDDYNSQSFVLPRRYFPWVNQKTGKIELPAAP